MVARFRVAVRLPAAVGVKDTNIPQLIPVARNALHWFCREKSLAFGPDTVTPVMVSVALPGLLSVNDWLLLALPTI